MNLECKLCNYKNSIKGIKENNKMDWLLVVTLTLIIWFFAGVVLDITFEKEEIPEMYRYK